MDAQQTIDEIESYVFNLKKEIEVTNKNEGGFIKTASFEFTAPTMAVSKHTFRLSQLVMRAIADSQKAMGEEAMRKALDDAKESGEDESIDASAVKAILLSSENVLFENVAESFIGLAISVGYADKDVPLNAAIINKVSPGEFMDMACGYIAHFICPSL